ncbi:2-hydroxymuconate semialdehyde hydrolase-like [Impatiens glandulifera]|uniref:2-hydroxymuconate semialdehyde hydrolase-like n=1 Tax=Impatiens glandulifera TaxID=253017 RepID=UPI001FB11191|nr:2-hydroxymuconate semialdehyde hydrolase-like [Impatiens glandulifera]
MSSSSSCISLASLYEGYIRRCFSGAGLSNKTVEIDGGETTMEYWGPTKETGSKPALVLIHGFGPETIWQWRRQATAFSRDYDIYAPNLVFFGDSTTKSAQRSEIFQAECVVKLMETLNVEKFNVMGTSYGGFVAYRIALKWPEKVEKVIIASSGINMRLRDNLDMVQRAKVEGVEDVLLPTNLPHMKISFSLISASKSHIPDFILKDMLKRLFSHNRNSKIELLQGLTIGKDDKVNVSPLQQDVLLVWGEQDRIFFLENANELKELLGEKTRLEVIKNTGHIPQIESPDTFNNIVRKFLSGAT